MSAIYDQVIDLCDNLPIVREWPELKELIQRAALQRPSDWLLPVYVCKAADGNSERAVTAVSAAACLQISIILVDDILDDDPRGEYRLIGYGQAANQALALQAAALTLLERSHLSVLRKQIGMNMLNQAALKTAYGQHLDVNEITGEADYWRLVHTKSSPYFSALWQLGALFSDVDANSVETLGQIGAIYGEIIQIHDDLNDAMSVPASPDWLQRRASLPILFATIVNHPEQEKFRQLYNKLPDAGALLEAQQILINCGAVSYCIEQLLIRYSQTQSLLASMNLAQAEILEKVLHETIEPVAALFKELGLINFAQLLSQKADL